MAKKIVLLFTLITLVNAVLWGIPSKTNNSWQKVDGRADGSWSDAAHWTLGIPGAAHYAYFPGSLGSYTVTFPKGDVEIATSFRANVVEGECVTFDGRGSDLRQGARESDTYHNEPFGFRYKGGHFFESAAIHRRRFDDCQTRIFGNDEFRRPAVRKRRTPTSFRAGIS